MVMKRFRAETNQLAWTRRFGGSPLVSISIGSATYGTDYTITNDATYTYYNFLATGKTMTLTPSGAASVNYIAVGGGGGGGFENSGGGGGGGIRTGTGYALIATSYNISNGTGGISGSSGSRPGGTGGNTMFGGITAFGGGGGGGNTNNATTTNGQAGGCGGGGAYSGTLGTGGTGSQGGDGGAASSSSGGGGGGGGGTGGNGGTSVTGAGGAGYVWNNGTSISLAGGGSGGGQGGLTSGAAIAGGGAGGIGNGANGTAGTANTGGGGGGGGPYSGVGGVGGSGFVSVGFKTSLLTGLVFLPTLLPGNVLWLDAADTSSLTFSSGSNISQWKDKSGLNNHATSYNTPVLTANAINTYQAIATPTNQYFLGATSITGTTLTVFSVAQTSRTIPNTAIDQRLVSLAGNSGADYSSTAVVIGLFNQGSSVNKGISTYRTTTIASNAISQNTPFQAVCEYDGTNGFQWKDGVSGGSSASTGTFGIAKYGIGNQANPTAEYWNGAVGEVIIYNVALSDTNRQKVEGYLAWKWGIQGSLPAGHPYKSVAPTG